MPSAQCLLSPGSWGTFHFIKTRRHQDVLAPSVFGIYTAASQDLVWAHHCCPLLINSFFPVTWGSGWENGAGKSGVHCRRVGAQTHGSQCKRCVHSTLGSCPSLTFECRHLKSVRILRINCELGYFWGWENTYRPLGHGPISVTNWWIQTAKFVHLTDNLRTELTVTRSTTGTARGV